MVIPSQMEIEARLAQLDVEFNQLGFDRFGISKGHLKWFYKVMGLFYFNYFRVQIVHQERVPSRGRCMLIGNHSGGIPVDGGMVSAALFYGLDTPRHPHGMVEKFAQNVPFLSSWFSRMGQLTGLPEHAKLLLDNERLLVVFPEGVRGIGKLWSQRYQLERFGTGFMRIALETRTPIIPFAFVGGEEAFPTVMHLNRVAKLIGVPYLPIPKHIVPVPKPVPCRIHFGEPMYFEGDGSEGDDVIEAYVQEVRKTIADLIEEGRQEGGFTT